MNNQQQVYYYYYCAVQLRLQLLPTQCSCAIARFVSSARERERAQRTESLVEDALERGLAEPLEMPMHQPAHAAHTNANAEAVESSRVE